MEGPVCDRAMPRMISATESSGSDTSLDRSRVAPVALFGLEPERSPDALAELQRQTAAMRSAPQPGALRLLVTAESAGALAAAEMWHTGLPWRVDVHERHDASDFELRTEDKRPLTPADEDVEAVKDDAI